LQSHRYPHFSPLGSSLPTDFCTTPSQPDSHHHPIWQYHHPHHHLRPPLSLWEKCSNRQQSWAAEFWPPTNSLLGLGFVVDSFYFRIHKQGCSNRAWLQKICSLDALLGLGFIVVDSFILRSRSRGEHAVWQGGRIPAAEGYVCMMVTG
jgi:hypothetical protein